MLKIKIPKLCKNEQCYVLDILLSEFLGFNFEVETYEGDLIEITRPGDFDNFSKLTLNASFFHKAKQDWLKPKSMPVLPLSTWNPTDDGIKANLVLPNIPVLYGSPGLVKNGKHIHLNLDIFGSAFFMLSRYEEAITEDRDEHERFPARASVSFKENFLNRPIVNEYLEILFECLLSIWPDLSRKQKQFKKIISCDLDCPFDLASYSLKKTILRVGARLIRDMNPKLALYDLLNYIFKKFNSDHFDQYRNNIDWMMKVNDASDNKVTFNFIPIQTDPNNEEANDVRSEKISDLLKHIIDSGHEIGFHPGYNTYKFTENFNNSVNALKEACVKKGIDPSNLGGRQHYLRFDILKTPILWETNGFTYDSSLGYADQAGFRCGVCYEYTMYNLVNRNKMKLKERPLIVMEGSIIETVYEALGYTSKANERFEYFANICQKFKGDYTLLWHNSKFYHPKARTLYKKLISIK